eukprot:230205_1
MNACHQNVYKGKQKLIDMDVSISMQEMPKINQFMKSLPDFPKYKVKNILLNADEDNTKDPEYSIIESNPKSSPDCILGNWLFLGDHTHCKSLQTIKEIGITHILVCSDIIPTYFSDANITYARIPISDTNCANIYNYFYAAKQFIDLCNPLQMKNSDINYKILVHCEVGMSRSSAIIIAYLISTKVTLNEQQQFAFDIIQTKLNEFERDEYNEYKMKQIKNNIVFMKLNEAYYYTQSCRNIIEPNLGFCKQLEKWEKLFHGKRSTLQDLPKYTSPYSQNDTKLGKSAARIAKTNVACDCAMM